MLLGDTIRLRAIEREDLPHFVEWLNDPQVRHYILRFAPLSLASEQRWFDSLKDDHSEFVFAIEAREGDGWRLLGSTGLHKLDWKNRSAEMGIFVGDKAQWGKGYGTQATRVLVRFAFRELNLHRVCLDVYDFNERAIRSYEKVGFQREGVKRQALFRDGRYRDVILMSLLQDEYAEGD